MKKIILGLVLLVFIFAKNLYSQDKEISYSDNSIYFGSLKNGISNGLGTFTVNNQVCVGEWDGHRTGKNITCTWSADSKWKGDKYVGALKNGKREGKGTYYYSSSGEKYVGEWKNGEFNGKGIMSFPNGNEYIGEWKNSKKNGEGTNKFSDGKLIKEIWSDGTLVRSNDDYKYNKKTDQQLENKKLIAEKQKEIQEVKQAEENKKKELIAEKQKQIQEVKQAKQAEENMKKKLITEKQKQIQEAKQAEENKKKELITNKQKTDEEKANKLLAGMKPEERRAHICEKTYGLRKGSDKFSECVYKILAADVELEKIELQKKLTEAQLETARANEAAARANASANSARNSAPTYDPAIGRAAERAQELETARLAFELARQLNPQRYAPQQQNSIQFPKQQYCKLNPINNRISCYTTP
jgi:hypothetical protein